MGKAYANRKRKQDRPQGDLYETPYGLTWKLIHDTGELRGYDRIVDPCAGRGAIIDAIDRDKSMNHVELLGFDIEGPYGSLDLFDYSDQEDLIVTNFPFSTWDDCVRHCLTFSKKVITIGRLNYFGTHDRNRFGLWSKLKKVYVFDRMVDYRGQIYSDGSFHVGALVTGWFVFQERSQEPIEIEVLDVQEYATRGAVK